MAPAAIPVILSGGRGTRLWPLSRRRLPKQFQPLVDTTTPLQDTARRLGAVEGTTRPIVVCAREMVDEIDRQLREVDSPPLVTVAEPVGRNTTAAVVAAAIAAPPDSILVVVPADHLLRDQVAFAGAVQTALAAAADGALVLFGVRPDRPETGYGYVAASGDGAVRRVEEFVEKPDRDRAAGFVAGGGHFWNSGMFVFRPEVIIEEVGRHEPAVLEAVRRAWKDPVDGLVELGPDFASSPAVPIDVAVMERTDRALLVVLEAGWDDIGSWRSVWSVAGPDGDGNVLVGDVVSRDVTGSYLRAGERPLVALGVEDLVVVDAGDVVFVAPMDRAQDVRDLVAELDRDRPELT